MDPTQEKQMRKDFAVYTDSVGLLSNIPNPPLNSTGNGLLYTSFYYMTLYLWGVLTEDDKNQFVSVVQSCRKDSINGLYNRSPQKTDQEGPDDYLGIVAASCKNALNVPLADQVYQYGLSTGTAPFNWIYNNETPGVFTMDAWFGRQLQLPAIFSLGAGVQPPLWRKLWMIGAIQLGGTSNPQDNNGVILSWCSCATMDPADTMLKDYALYWIGQVLKNYPNGMKEVWSTYFNNPSHPLAVWSVTEFPWQISASAASKTVVL